MHLLLPLLPKEFLFAHSNRFFSQAWRPSLISVICEFEHFIWNKKLIENIQEVNCFKQFCISPRSSKFWICLDGKPTIAAIPYEAFKTLSDLSSNFMKEIYYLSPYLTPRRGNLYVYSRKTLTFGSKSVRSLGSCIWNSLPWKQWINKNRNKLKDFMKKWSGPPCEYNLCCYTYVNCDSIHTI